ncbi:MULTISPECIES: hypothetical protein [Ochrobactrum]|uniref:Uncharacterized protein n=1 Tax=Ochrobactrum soli TaxID=2448455 RepID=A0A849KML4_9HYPH|nr:hypothetical protein [[Ochrobactrum] soli]MCI1001087.1 hypothetical protein [Ochrobactrum sp. C6C9]NNU58694.1 hypothetical protein [[Ochrobactrum] soli]
MDGYGLEIDDLPLGILIMDSYDTKKVKGSLTNNGAGFKGKVLLFVHCQKELITIDEGSSVLSNDDGKFEFTVESNWYQPNFGSSHDELYATIECSYSPTGVDPFTVTNIKVIVKPTPI